MIHRERKGDVLEVVLDLPPRNVLTTAALEELGRAIPSRAEPGVRALVLRAAGKAFSAGADVAEHLPDKLFSMLAAFGTASLALHEAPHPTIAVVDGGALGGGCEVALLCDFVLASERSTLGLPEIGLAALAPVAAALLPALVGPRETARLLLEGKVLPAPEAARIGLITRAVPGTELEAAVEAQLAALRRSSPAILSVTALAQRRACHPRLRERLQELERLYHTDVASHPDAEEGLRAFLEKRAPRWRDVVPA